MTGQLLRCASCGRWVPLLVDDGPLCMSCDSLHYPPTAVVVHAPATPASLRVVA